MGRPVSVINLDPANDVIPFEPDIDISSLVKTGDVMETFKLGPNGGLMYSMQCLEENVSWLVDKINNLKVDQTKFPNIKMSHPYLLIDCPGQIELYTHSQSFARVIQQLTDRKSSNLDLRLVSVYLLDSHYTNDPGKFISAILSTLCCMLHLELPHVSILSKVDLLPKNTRFDLGYYCEVMDLSYLVDDLVDDPFLKKYKELTKDLAETIENYSLVSFVPVNVNDNRTILRAMRLIDRANGFHLLDMETEEAVARIFRDYESADFEYSKFGPLSEKITEVDDNKEEDGDGVMKVDEDGDVIHNINAAVSVSSRQFEERKEERVETMSE